MGASKRRRIEPTHDWQLLLPLFEWPEQERYEQIRPLVLFDASVAKRAARSAPLPARSTGGWTASRRKAWSPSSTPRPPNAGGCRPRSGASSWT